MSHIGIKHLGRARKYSTRQRGVVASAAVTGEFGQIRGSCRALTLSCVSVCGRPRKVSLSATSVPKALLSFGGGP